MVKTPKMITPEQLAASGTEHGEQSALFLWRAINVGRLPQLKWLHAIPNGGSRGDNQRARAIRGATLKAEGVRKGVSDVFLPCAMSVSEHGAWLWRHGLYIEMKRSADKEAKKRAGATSDAQDEFRVDMRAAGYACAICYTWIEAVATIEAYLRGEV